MVLASPDFIDFFEISWLRSLRSRWSSAKASHAAKPSPVIAPAKQGWAISSEACLLAIF